MATSINELSDVFKIDDVSINVINQKHALSEIGRRVGSSQSYCFFTMNLDHCVKIREEGNFKRAYMDASLVSMDGWPIVLLSRWFTRKFARVTGSDLILPICGVAEKIGARVYLFGADDVVLEAARQKLLASNPNLNIVGTFAPSQDFKPTSEEADHAIDLISNSEADICFVALGAPKQEIFSHNAAMNTSGVGFICIGAGLDFLAGKQTRAPKIIRLFGLEWAWRLGSNPRRMGRRYASCVMVLSAYLFDLILGRSPGGVRVKSSRV